jgi:hypothetical protein
VEKQVIQEAMMKHLIMFYRYGGKNLYYFNTYDGQGEIDINKMNEEPLAQTSQEEMEAAECDSCVL